MSFTAVGKLGNSGQIDDRRKFRGSRESEARILLLIDTFSRDSKGRPRSLEGRVKLAKLDFLLRYPRHLERILQTRNTPTKVLKDIRERSTDLAPLDEKMIRYRYGPWDPSYYALLGSLIGRELVSILPTTGTNGLAYRTTTHGEQVAGGLASDEIFDAVIFRARILARYLDLSGTTLKNLLYELPDVADADWHEELE